MVTEIKSGVLLSDRINVLLAKWKEEYDRVAMGLGIGLLFKIKDAAHLMGRSSSFLYKKAIPMGLLYPVESSMSNRKLFTTQRLAEYSVRVELMEEGEELEDIDDILRRR